MFRWLEALRAGGRRRRVLFVCLGNSCRSPMAEAFASAFGEDILVAESAGLLPSDGISKHSRLVMKEKNIPIRKRVPRLLTYYNLAEFDLVVNMTGRPLTFATSGEVVEWEVADPAGMKLAHHRAVRDRIEALVRNLVANLRFRVGFAPHRDRAQSAGARLGMRLFLLALVCAGPMFSTPIFEQPADLSGLRTSQDLISIGRAGRDAWISWDINPAPDGGFFYHYEIGGLRANRLWMLYIESETGDAIEGMLFRGVGHNCVFVDFYSRGAPVWGDFVLVAGLRTVVFNPAWLQPHSPSVNDFIARPGAAEPAETTEPSEFIPLAMLLAAIRGRHRTRAKLKLFS